MPTETTCSPTATPESIPSAQLRPDGITARFAIAPWGDRFDWQALAVAESRAGVDASIRLFLDEQLESGDVVLDLSPGAGFVTLAAATADSEPHVMALLEDEAQDAALREAVDAAGAFVEQILATETSAVALLGLAQERLLGGARLFIHASPVHVAQWLPSFAPLADAGAIVAWLMSGDDSADSRVLASASLRAHGFLPHVLAELDGDAQLFPAEPTDAECIALHQSVFGGESGNEAGASHMVPAGGVPEANPVVVAPDVPFRADVSTRVTGLHLIAPFCRTGYGITGAHLLRALMARGARVSLFPLGAVDASVLPFEGIEDALSGQDAFDPSWPSVRLSQQFDLALHVGRGPRIGFPIFELTRFTARERHHLLAQDRLLVCSEWARGVLLENGVSRIPIHVVPLGVDRSVFHERLDAGRPSGETVFLQVGKLEARKGQLELLRAFEAAFNPRDPVRLVLACHNPFMQADAFRRAMAPFRNSPMAKRITLHARPFATHREIAALMATADCGVFLSRGEGWNLEALEMLSVGRTVVATDYSAHTEFLTDRNARLVRVDGLEVVPGAASDACWAAWGDAQHEQTVATLRAVHAERLSGSLSCNDAGIETAKHFSWDNTADTLLDALSTG